MGCGRERRVCWVMPCLYLEQVMQRGEQAVTHWVHQGLPRRLRRCVIVRRAR